MQLRLVYNEWGLNAAKTCNKYNTDEVKQMTNESHKTDA